MGVLFPEVPFTGHSEPPDTGWVLHALSCPHLQDYRLLLTGPQPQTAPLSASLSCLLMVTLGPSVTIFSFLLFKTEPNSVVKSTG